MCDPVPRVPSRPAVLSHLITHALTCVGSGASGGEEESKYSLTRQKSNQDIEPRHPKQYKDASVRAEIEATLKEAFRVADTNQDGHLSFDEMTAMYRRVTASGVAGDLADSVAQRVFTDLTRMDSNKDYKVCFAADAQGRQGDARRGRTGRQRVVRCGSGQVFTVLYPFVPFFLIGGAARARAGL